MSPDSEEPLRDLGAVLQNALAKRDEDEDEPSLDVVSSGGLHETGAAAPDSGDPPYLVLLKAAVSMVQTGELSMDEYVEGVEKLDVIADNALKVYSVPAVKNDLPGKLDDYQNSLVASLEAELRKMKKGLGILLSYPETLAVGDLETGLATTASAMLQIKKIEHDADTERERLLEEEKEEKARRAQKAAEAEA